MTEDRRQSNDSDNLDDFKSRLGSNEDFYPNDAEVDRLVTALSAEIETTAQVSPPEIAGNITSIRGWWQRVAAMAAAVVLVLGTGWVGYRVGISVDSADQVADTEHVASGEVVAMNLTDEDVSLDDSQVELLLREAATADGLALSEELLGDLTEEEVEYLTESFDVGELLL